MQEDCIIYPNRGKITYNFQNNNSLSFATRENKKTNITEFYNLIYQYRNDCLEAAIEYNKDYYADANTEPEEQLFFSIYSSKFLFNSSTFFLAKTFLTITHPLLLISLIFSSLFFFS